MLQNFLLVCAGAVGVLLPLGGILWLVGWFVEREALRQRIWRIYFWTLGVAEVLLAVSVGGFAASPGRR